jgi:hypothetical protein
MWNGAYCQGIFPLLQEIMDFIIKVKEKRISEKKRVFKRK